MRTLRFGAAGLALLAAGCHTAAPPADPPAQTVRVGTVEQIRPDTPERYSATILPVAQIDLAFKSGGLIEAIHQVRGADGRMRHVQAGDQVAAGTELAVVRRIDYEQRVERAQDQQRQAEAQLTQAAAVLRDAELTYGRANRLYESASLTKPDYDQARARLETAAEQVEGAKAALGGARAAVSEARLGLSDTTVRAPFTGWVTGRYVEPGSLVGNATNGFSMVDISTVKAVFAVPDTSLREIHLGRRLTMLLDALEHPVAGTVTSVSPQADPKTHVFSVEVSIPNPRGEIRPGMIGSLTLGPAQQGAARLVVPLSAVVRAPGHPNGFAVFGIEQRGGKNYARAREITAGGTFGNAIEVTSGLSAGERIVALGGELLRDGAEVRPLP
jgi:RND family efflux transporter MFP subunit